MSSKDNGASLRDMLECIDNIRSFIGDADYLAFLADTKTRSAVERQLQTSRRLLFASELMRNDSCLESI